MPRKKPPTEGRGDRQTSKVVDQMAAKVRREVLERLGPNSTFEERRNKAFEIMKEVLWKDADDDLKDTVTDAEEVEVDGKKYKALEQPSSALYFGRWGAHFVEERLFREAGVHNGPTIKPVERRAGIVFRMTPDLARVVGALDAEASSRGIVRILRTVGYYSPSRAFLAHRASQLNSEISDLVPELERAVRTVEVAPTGIASLSCGLDRMSIRMTELADPANVEPPKRTEPYERAPPPPKEYHDRKAWVGTATAYDIDGNELHTWRYSVEASADPVKLADRVAADVAWLVDGRVDLPIHCIQDGAPELGALGVALKRALPDHEITDLIDLEHLMDYLEDVVDAETPDDPQDMKGWYRSQLLTDDNAIDRILRNLRYKAKKLPHEAAQQRKAVAAALSYIRRRREKMRYATHYQANLPIGSGATEGTCWEMQRRVKLPGQSWEEDGLRGILATRGLVLSDRWDAAWPHYAQRHRSEVRATA